MAGSRRPVIGRPTTRRLLVATGTAPRVRLANLACGYDEGSDWHAYACVRVRVCGRRRVVVVSLSCQV